MSKKHQHEWAGDPQEGPANQAAQQWAALSWEDLDQWAGPGSVERGRRYQRQGRVKNLAVAADGRLLATVAGTERYVTSVWHKGKPGKASAIESRCTCPVGFDGCKHAVAVVAEFLHSLAEGTPVPLADEDDPRWAKLSDQADEDETFDDDDAMDEEEDDQEDERPPIKPPRAKAKPGRMSAADWDRKVEQHIREKTAGELADLVWSLVQRYPELREEFRERIALREGDVGRLLAQARRELRQVTGEPAWRDSWRGEGNIPDYSSVRRRLERLVELGHCDEVVSLGRELIDRGMDQVGQAQDEGDTGMALAECLPVVFRAVAGSSLTAPQKLLFAIDALLKDDYGVIGEAAQVVLDANWERADWSAVADVLAGRLGGEASVGKDDFSGRYHRDHVSSWLLTALKNAGRQDEVLAVMEREARATGSYERLVSHLRDARRYAEAEQWAREGIEKTAEKSPGIAATLAQSLCEIARQRKQWDVVAAHAAREFLQSPSARDFAALLAAARKAGCEPAVRDAALRFLETGASPVTIVQVKGQWQVKVAPEWPLPVPEYLVPMMRPWRGPTSAPAPRPRLDVLLDMAIEAKRPEYVLRWYDRIEAERGGHDQRGYGAWGRYGGPTDADRVAEAVSQSHPERALAIYRQRLEQQTAHADVSAYEATAQTLRKMRPVFKRLGREEEWPRLVADVRERHRNRPRFIEILERLEGSTILEGERKRRRR